MPPPAHRPLSPPQPGGRRLPRQLAARLRCGAGGSSVAPATEARGGPGEARLGWAGRAEPSRAEPNEPRAELRRAERAAVPEQPEPRARRRRRPLSPRPPGPAPAFKETAGPRPLSPSTVRLASQRGTARSRGSNVPPWLILPRLRRGLPRPSGKEARGFSRVPGAVSASFLERCLTGPAQHRSISAPLVPARGGGRCGLFLPFRVYQQAWTYHLSRK